VGKIIKNCLQDCELINKLKAMNNPTYLHGQFEETPSNSNAKKLPHEYCGAKHPDFWTKATTHCNERKGHAGDHQCIIYYEGRVNEKWENNQ